jgi:hypothetical protein
VGSTRKVGGIVLRKSRTVRTRSRNEKDLEMAGVFVVFRIPDLFHAHILRLKLAVFQTIEPGYSILKFALIQEPFPIKSAKEFTGV